MTTQQRAAYRIYRKALRDGALIPGPCDRPGDPLWRCRGPIGGHHINYDWPLEVRWLCASHHGLVHLHGEKWGRKAA